ncbi:diacylglycerol kinase [Jannaschia seohaensis]|uniref:Diacylglycerol kinase n=1 Tax=Jannaschia seohaensis TaxID=475081 RepID=A0A2Y9AA79_9RHOB|nr:diacylglycerol kinase [Jannaschia seohaensis]PWJ21064.1 diacylglycerol kinase (ATP) [Jannaschia seohaensis]SSA41474.1 diacylglycerol kinase (ATP) [Jannaschia seohaensis]
MTQPPPKGTKPVWAHLWDTLVYSLAGGRYLMTQRAAQLQAGMMAGTALAFTLAGVGPIQWAVAVALFLASLGIEALNTAIELIVDRVSPEISDFAKHAKDLGSFAVFCALLIFGGHAVWAVVDALLR